MSELETQPAKKRSWVKYDRYFWDFLDTHRLTANERFTLVAIVSETQWQDETWTGSLVDLSSRTKIPRGTLRTVVNTFVEMGIVECVRDFKSNSVGVFKLLCYEEMVVPTRKRTGRPVGSTDSYQRVRTPTTSVSSAFQERTNSSSSGYQVTSHIQMDETKSLIEGQNRYKSPREAVSSEVGSGSNPSKNRFTDEDLWPEQPRNPDGSFRSVENQTENAVPICLQCGQPCDTTHPFSHDAVLPDF
jgi:hypothetical protein